MLGPACKEAGINNMGEDDERDGRKDRSRPTRAVNAEAADAWPAAEGEYGEACTDEDSRGEVGADLVGPPWSQVKVEEERRVQALEQVVHRSKRALDKSAERVEAVWTERWQGKDGDGVDAIPIGDARAASVRRGPEQSEGNEDSLQENAMHAGRPAGACPAPVLGEVRSRTEVLLNGRQALSPGQRASLVLCRRRQLE